MMIIMTMIIKNGDSYHVGGVGDDDDGDDAHDVDTDMLRQYVDTDMLRQYVLYASTFLFYNYH